jgi:hypothetical protein
LRQPPRDSKATEDEEDHGGEDRIRLHCDRLREGGSKPTIASTLFKDKIEQLKA